MNRRDHAYTPPEGPQAVREPPWYVAAAVGIGAALLGAVILWLAESSAIYEAGDAIAERIEDSRAQAQENEDTQP